MIKVAKLRVLVRIEGKGCLMSLLAEVFCERSARRVDSILRKNCLQVRRGFRAQCLGAARSSRLGNNFLSPHHPRSLVRFFLLLWDGVEEALGKLTTRFAFSNVENGLQRPSIGMSTKNEKRPWRCNKPFF
jgi:hypothetical protein